MSNNFAVFLNKSRLSYDDRVGYDSLEFAWCLSDALMLVPSGLRVAVVRYIERDSVLFSQ